MTSSNLFKCTAFAATLILAGCENSLIALDQDVDDVGDVETQGVMDEALEGAIRVDVEADTFVVENSDAVHGDAPRLEVDTSDGGKRVESYMRFRIGEVGTVTRALLKLYVTNDSSNSATLYRLGDTSWSEATTQWFNKPAAAGTRITAVGGTARRTWIGIDITSVVQANSVLSLGIMPNSADGFGFASKESSSARPYLALEIAGAAPAPADAGTLPPPPPPPADAGVQPPVSVDAGTQPPPAPVDAGVQPPPAPVDAGTPPPATDAGTALPGDGRWSRLKAFPSAEGFGTETAGGRGGRVIKVTNLNDSGPGSFRAAVMATYPRIVVFDVSGTIKLASRVEIISPYLTIAGQTAPGGGITLAAAPGNLKGTMYISTHDVVMRHIRLRPGTPSGSTDTSDGLTVWNNGHGDPYNVVVDHCSFSWATDENLATYHGANRLTFSWNITSEALSNGMHPEGEHSKGLHMSGDGTHSLSVHHNLLAHNMDRNPQPTNPGLADYRNNVIYNYGKHGAFVSNSKGRPSLNFIGNYYKRGPDTASGLWEFDVYDGSGAGWEFFVAGNIGPHRPSDSLAQSAFCTSESISSMVAREYATAPVTTTDAFTAFDQVLAAAGATRPYRDPVDARVVNDVRNGTGSIIDHENEVGGYPTLPTAAAPVDSDADGMPDAWETARGLNPGADDSASDRNGDGYTNVEEYFNLLAP